MLDDGVKVLNDLSSWISNYYNVVRTRSVLGSARSPGHGPLVFGSFGDTAGSPCHARDAPGRLLGLPETEPRLEFTLVGLHDPQIDV
jgi:hypothetical protein